MKIQYSEISRARAEKVREEQRAKEARKIKTPKQLAVIDQAQCTGCVACVQFCPVDCIELSPGPDFPDMYNVVEIDLDRCIGCKLCVKACPWDTIHMIPSDNAYEQANDWTIRSVIHMDRDLGKLWVEASEEAPAGENTST